MVKGPIQFFSVQDTWKQCFLLSKRRNVPNNILIIRANKINLVLGHVSTDRMKFTHKFWSIKTKTCRWVQLWATLVHITFPKPPYLLSPSLLSSPVDCFLWDFPINILYLFFWRLCVSSPKLRNRHRRHFGVENVRWAWEVHFICTLRSPVVCRTDEGAVETRPICIQIFAFWNLGRITSYTESVAGFLSLWRRILGYYIK
jgi:hypothetical protein